MSDVVTMDDLSNEEILSILEDSVRLVPVARGAVHLPLLEGKVLANMFIWETINKTENIQQMKNHIIQIEISCSVRFQKNREE